MALKDLFKTKTQTAPEVQPQAEPAPAEPAAEGKKKRTNPQNDAKRTRNSQVKIRLTEEEVAELKAAASAAGMSMADYIMAGVRNRQVIKLPGAVKLRKEMLQEGRNLNQALYLAFSERKQGRPADMKSVQTAVTKVEENLDRLTELLIKWDIDLTERTAQEVKPNADNEVQGQ